MIDQTIPASFLNLLARSLPSDKIFFDGFVDLIGLDAIPSVKDFFVEDALRRKTGAVSLVVLERKDSPNVA